VVEDTCIVLSLAHVGLVICNVARDWGSDWDRDRRKSAFAPLLIQVPAACVALSCNVFVG
jgi:hypothetical protein